MKHDYSRIIFGAWRLADVPEEANASDVARKIAFALDQGITTFDHADIYGNYQCEKLFGDAFKRSGIPRNKVQLITKCGIKLLSERRPSHGIKSYDTSKSHIIWSVEQSLANLNTDFIDLLLIHRPDPLMDPREMGEAFSLLHTQGKVKSFGVSNFTASQVSMLNSSLNQKLSCNQIELSLLKSEAMFDGQLDQCLELNLVPMAWSPLAGGGLFKKEDERTRSIRECLSSLAKKYEVESPETIAYSWLLRHPAGICPVIGTGKESRIKAAVDSLKVKLEREDWYLLLKAAVGHDVP
jgi:predicted oxidoreductase